MLKMDTKQAAVLQLDVREHARVLGAPGTGKTTLLVESVKQLVVQGTFSFDEILILSSSRTVATRLRNKLEEAITGVIPGTLVRSAESYAFAVLAAHKAELGERQPSLLTGAAQDKLLESMIEQNLAELEAKTGIASTVLSSGGFRSELRDLERVITEWGIDSYNFKAHLEAWLERFGAELKNLSPLWASLIALLEDARKQQLLLYPDQFSSVQMLNAAIGVIKEKQPQAVKIPKLILIDDAQEVTKATINLLMPLAEKGAAVWAFGDPDIATGAFQGENMRFMKGINQSFKESGALQNAQVRNEQLLVLDTVYRHSEVIRNHVASITNRIGAAGVGQQRAAVAREPDGSSASVAYTKTASLTEQVGVIAHTLRSAYFGTHDNLATTTWNEMVVICRSQQDAQRIQQTLNHFEVPTMSGSGGITLRNHALVRDLIRVLQHASGFASLEADILHEILIGPLGKFDGMSYRRLKQELIKSERRRAAESGEEAKKFEELLFHFLATGFDEVHSAESAKFAAIIAVFTAASISVAEGATARETLWQIWSKSGLSQELSTIALEGRGSDSKNAHETLDAVVALFYVLQRHEEQASTVPIAEVLDELLTTDVAQDTLAQRAEHDAVLVTTVQGVVGQEFDLVCVVGPQEGVWPNLRARGSTINLSVFERLLATGFFTYDDRTSTLHDELRLFSAATSKAKRQILVVAIQSEEEFPSVFYTLGRDQEVFELPSERFTLRGLTSSLRSRLERDDDAQDAAHSLAVLAMNNIAGANPDDWYGVREPSNLEPLVNLDTDPEATVRVSPSAIEVAENCALNWAINYLGGGAAEISAHLGTLIHKALEEVTTPNYDSMLEIVEEGWSHLDFDAEWQSERDSEYAKKMVQGLVDYIADTSSNNTLVDSESWFELRIDQAVLGGIADRIETFKNAEGVNVPLVVDLKTITSKPSAAEVEGNVQMQAYQAGLLLGAFESVPPGQSGGAKLLYVHPNAQTSKTTYRTFDQPPMTIEQLGEFKERIKAVAKIMAAGDFEANVEHHCLSSRYKVSCSIHVVPAVSHT